MIRRRLMLPATDQMEVLVSGDTPATSHGCSGDLQVEINI
jgi:hypothetical protein